VVSYVINNGPRPVAPATRERVLAAIKELGYRPDRVAQAMASRRTDLIGLIIPDARQPFFGEMAHAVEQAASERGKMVLVGNTDYVGEREVHYLRAFLGMRVSGLILVSHALNDLAAAEIDAWDARVVLLHERPEAIDDVAVVTDDLVGAQHAVRHLLEHGYEYVACMGGTAETPAVGDPVSDHVEGWRRAMDEAGISTEGRLFEAPYNRTTPTGSPWSCCRGRTGRPPSSAPPTTRRSACCGPRVSCASTCPASWAWPASTTSRRRRSPIRR
jgi:LacI family transcriptional regulator